MSDGGRICEHCGAPLRALVDGFCPFCRTRPFGDPAAAGGAPAGQLAVVLLDAGRNKIGVIKALRELAERDLHADLGLAEAKDLVDRADPTVPPRVVVTTDPAIARSWADELTRAGARVDLHGHAEPAGAGPSAAPAPAPAAGGAEAVWLLAPGRNKIGVIKELRGVTGLGLREAKDLVDGADRAPACVVVTTDPTVARDAATRLASAGATVEVHPA